MEHCRVCISLQKVAELLSLITDEAVIRLNNCNFLQTNIWDFIVFSTLFYLDLYFIKSVYILMFSLLS